MKRNIINLGDYIKKERFEHLILSSVLVFILSFISILLCIKEEEIIYLLPFSVAVMFWLIILIDYKKNIGEEDRLEFVECYEKYLQNIRTIDYKERELKRKLKELN